MEPTPEERQVQSCLRPPKSRQSSTPEKESSKEDEDEDSEGESVTHIDPAMEEAAKADATAFIMQSLLNEHLAANWVAPETEGTVPSMLYRPLEAWPLTRLSTPASRVPC
jgi:hypothetical protein